MTAEDWQIPSLNPSLQLDQLALPVLPYGTVPRTQVTGGTIHFYVDDAKFSRLVTRPDRLLAHQPAAAFEPNFSTGPDIPRALALAGICHKRRIAAYWQAHGIPIAVDLNVDDACLDLALLGVPAGWWSYATRMHRRDTMQSAVTRWRLAVEHAGTTAVRFIVVGGGKRVEAECLGRGWTYVPEHCRVVRGKAVPYGSNG